MDDLISRQAASGCEYWDSESNFCSLHRPSAERHGMWIDIEQAPHKCVYATCSVCGERQTLEKMNYCPSCGSRMESKCVKCEGGYCEDECGAKMGKAVTVTGAYCNRNLCKTNELNGIGCDECEIAKYNNLEDDDTPCLNCDEVTL